MTSPATSAPASGLIPSLPGIMHERARRAPDRTILTMLDGDGETVASLTAVEFDLAARSLAVELLSTAEPGDRVLVPAMPGLRFHIAFMACLYAHLIAIPVPAVRPGGAARKGDARSSRFSRLTAICADVDAAVAVVPGDRVPELESAWADHSSLNRLRLVAAESRGPAERMPRPEPVDADEIAFLQYTSGSTSTPRGVMITHGAMLANQAAMRGHLGVTAATTLVTWLPPYHDMGLTLGLLMPMYDGLPAVIIEPETFLLHPDVWLRAISRFSDVASAAPDFAYSWCVRRVSDQVKAGLDLSGWRVAVSGSETVHADTLRRFEGAFAGCGLSARTLTPAYGMAEATLFVTGGSGRTAPVLRRYDREALSGGRALPAAEASGAAGAVEIVGCGRPGPGIRVAVVEPDTRRPCPERVVGEIWVRSPGLGTGYWGRPKESQEVFAAEPDGDPRAPGDAVLGDDPQDTGAAARHWLRTGDLGFIDDGELFITGRHKEVMLIHGANYYPQDFERLAQRAHPLLGGGLAAAYTTEDENRVTVVVESTSRAPEAAAEAAATAVRAVSSELPVMTDVVVVPRGQLPRTTSGKVRRRECAERMRDGRLRVLARWPRATG